MLESHKLDPTPVGLFDFMESGIELREYAFRVFPQSVNILELIADFGERLGIGREDLAYTVSMSSKNSTFQAQSKGFLLQILKAVRKDMRKLSLLLFRPHPLP